MGRIILVIGGARSGKSRYGQSLMEPYGEDVAYVATAKITDDDMAERVRHHKANRPVSWQTIEGYKDLPDLLSAKMRSGVKVMMLECITTLVTNLMFETSLDYDQASNQDIEAVEQEIDQQIEALLLFLKQQPYESVLITNEVGYGLVAPYRLGNIFRDIAGRINQKIAQSADEVNLVVAGIPIKIKGEMP